MKNSKRILSLILALVLVLSVLPISALAVDVVASGTCGENLTWVLTDDGTLTISGTGAMDNFGLSPNNVPWYSMKNQVKQVVIADGVTSIGDYAFCYCSSMTNVTIPGSVTSIGDSAFVYCISLTSVTIPDSVTTIDKSAFIDCSGLTSVTISDNVTTIGNRAFGNCEKLQTISVSQDNPNYSSVDGVLFDKMQTVLLQYPNGKELSVYAIPSSVTAIGNYAFYGCLNLTDMTIPGSVTAIGEGAFSWCSSMTSMTILDGVTTIGDWAFSECSSLIDVTISDSVTTIGSYVFYDCTGLTSVTIPNSVTELGDAVFSWCGRLTSVTLSNSITSIGQSVFAWCGSLTSVTIPKSVTSIGSTAFAYSGRLTSVTINNPECFIYDDINTCGNPGTTVIHGYAGSTAQAYAEKYGYQFVPFTGFSDVKETAWYYKPVLWAAGNGITGGVGDGKFAPNATCTRAQVVTFLWNAAGKPEPKSTTNPFSDVKTTDYFYKAVLWAVENGVTSGVGDGKFGTKQVCTRGQVVAFMWNAAGKPEPKTTTNSFSDVKTSDYYYKAVLWAVENGVTSGTGNGQFSPKAQCTRAQVVTFLYSYYG